MISTGDVHSGLRKLESLLRVIRYPEDLDYNKLSKGDPSAFLPIVSFTLTTFSPPFAEQLLTAGFELIGKTDLRFTDTLYKLLRDIFYYKPVLTKQQFFQLGFSQRKISFICDIITLVLQKHNQLKKPKVRRPVSHSNVREESHTANPDARSISTEPFIVNLPETQSSPTTMVSSAEEFPSRTPHSDEDSFIPSRNEMTKVRRAEEPNENTVCLSEMDRRLSTLEDQLNQVLSGLNKLDILEKRLDEIKNWKSTDKNDKEVITISRESWENLMGRVLLLETKLELKDPKSLQFCEDDLKGMLGRITNMLKSTSGLLRKEESSAPALS
ncbi:centrosomal protein of 44 kDa [Oryzias melastigma]|uniref:Centrosomal protein of 44 kDa n=1 Tax=Oryzias melastigma TaxID=30732 RepID=A0A3B3DN02_ORYME|nr:centrosomal protein of 44 kDa [Oryzias melastigma]XP_024115516.1 centrosomal protein of 44 kDa [Oryzias melastigma]XP_024115517.1 centrosomal protein of 44 kDa [Oryzias melastigma]XP_036067587.1 centrosomal protein of 44 kDa [Oryzias melastigma]